MTKEKFHEDFVAAAKEAEKNHSVKDLCVMIGVGRSVYYRWKRGVNAPILIARYAVLQYLNGLVH